MSSSDKKEEGCAYCDEGELLDAFGIKIAQLPASKLVLFKEQSHRGRLIVASTHHVSEIVDLSESERKAFVDDIVHVADAMHKALHPDKINYGAYGDGGHHLHCHLCPKYADDSFEWGSVFAMNPDRVHLDEDGYRDLAKLIVDNL
ncbi:HIT family protein [Bifidobacterium sp. ESL0763]|uniref:HIT family protein n=1 Tax=Bifidobacterium sp. ESL0763 TaxID=2983227 RepID=UPI0023F7ED5E|nr:HIT family protein [Bifidobacterium sp. ESL0763]MDF7664389.1 HIT family protein [Bifidobacterium sp. ESL0763]